MTRSLSLLISLLALWMLAVTLSSAAPLRGFGAVSAVALPSGQGVRFDCDSDAHAVLLIQKLANDMAASATIPSRWSKVEIGDESVPVLVRPGLGAYLLLARGNTAYCLTAPLSTGQDESRLGSAFPAAVNLLPGAVTYDAGYTYPVYLDKWSSKGIGTWYTPYDLFGDDPPGLGDIVTPQLEYLNANHLTIQITDFGPAREEMDRCIKQYQEPYHIAHWMEWDDDIARLDPFDLIQPGPLFTAYSDYYTELSFGGDRLQQYRNWSFQQFVKKYVNDPLLIDWDEPHGELGPAFYLNYNDFGKENREHFVAWLQTERHYTLPSLGQAWHNNPKYFASWASVPIPLDYSFLGCDKNCLLADHGWHRHTGSVDDGVQKGFTQNNYNDSRWPSVKLPGGELGTITEETHQHFWYRGTVTVPAPYLAAHPHALYLNIATWSQSGGPNNPDKVWFNGVDLGALSEGGGLGILGFKDISGLVRPGVNHIVYSPAEPSFPGTFFLSPKPTQYYPTNDSGVNARIVDWNEYIASSAVNEVRNTLKAIRGVDPNRPIKIMTANPWDMINPMMADYGCFQHNTGDEAFFRPWEPRGGYPYGLKTSAEVSASMLDAVNYKRWLGWFVFERLNAFDNFIDVESMMYSPVTPLWKANFPYLHLANRYNLKKPEIGLLWSAKNSRVTEDPHTTMPWTYDLGRGDIQSSGYSYVYFDEPAIRRGLENGYKVVWDCGTTCMSPETVNEIKKYVEQGGTFVALQETGRHTFTQRDVWPIVDLTGFKVSQIRPMGGFVSILDDQPLFTALRGKNFLNEGRSVDYSNYNFADECTSLQPVAPGTQAIARYRDGTIAIGMRKLGKGKVVVLGSPFWRDSYDKAGMWWPSANECTFITDLLTGLGVSPDVPATTSKVWRDRYIADNGTEEYLVLYNPSQTDSQSFTTDWNLSFPFNQVFDPKTGQPVDADISGNTAHLSLTMDPQETRILAVQSERPTADTVADWFHDLSVTWKASLPGHIVSYPDLPHYYAVFPDGVGKVVDTSTVTSDRLTDLSSTPDLETGWNTHLNMIRTSFAGISTTPDQSVIYRREMLHMPADFQPGDIYRLRLNVFQDYPTAVYFNGVKVADASATYNARDTGLDVTNLMRFTKPNIMVVLANSKGAAVSPDLWRVPAATEKISLMSAWKDQADEDHAPQVSMLTGQVTGLYFTKAVVVPASWKGSHVFLRSAWTGASPGRLAVNDRTFFYQTDTPRDMDVTPWIKFGQSNQILIQPSNSSNHWQPGSINIQSMTLERVPHVE